MKKNILRVVSTFPGFLMGINGIGWLVQPEETAKGLGMPLLDGIGRSTQIGDFGAFFLGVTILVFVGAIRAQGHWLYSAALFLGGAAVIRVFAALVHDAGMATEFIIAEIVMTIWLVVCAYLMDKSDSSNA